MCDRGHRLKRSCNRRNDKCSKCVEEDIETESRIKRDLKLEAERVARQELYKKDLEEIQGEIDHQRRMIKYKKDEEEQQKTLAQQRADLAALKDAATRILNTPKPQAEPKMPGSFPGADPPTPPSDTDTLEGIPEGANQEWEYLKQFEGAKSKPLDELMGMIGLEDVKSEFLSIKSKIDTALRQSIPLDKERFSCSMLGNPGTGMLTLAIILPHPCQLTFPRQNYCGSSLRSIFDIHRCDPRNLLPRRDWGQSRKCWCVWLQEDHRWHLE